jgi:hypothetical protein
MSVFSSGLRAQRQPTSRRHGGHAQRRDREVHRLIFQAVSCAPPPNCTRSRLTRGSTSMPAGTALSRAVRQNSEPQPLRLSICRRMAASRPHLSDRLKNRPYPARFCFGHPRLPENTTRGRYQPCGQAKLGNSFQTLSCRTVPTHRAETCSCRILPCPAISLPSKAETSRVISGFVRT